MSLLRRLVAELSRRRVFRVAGAYAAAGLAVIYAGDAILPRLGLDRAQSVLVVLVILGFPLALALAWAFDVTPEGVRRTPPTTPPGSSEDERSIVVLPFDNMSPDPQDAYLGDGLTEELTSKLSRLASLRVISRTSATQMKRSDKELAIQARELDIHYMLEGSVRKAGAALRITAQLIDATSDRHLWSETYAGTMDDVFGVQEQVALAIVDALQVRLTPGERHRLAQGQVQNFQAYQFYVEARAQALLLAENTLERALGTVDAGLAAVGEHELLLSARGLTLFEAVNGIVRPPSEHAGLLDEAERCADRALELNPSSAAARFVKGAVLHARGDIPAAVAHYATALAVDPNHPEALFAVGYFSAAGGWNLDGARAALQKLERLDPLTPLNAGGYAWVHWFEGDFEAAARRLMPLWSALGPGSPWLVLRAYFEAGAGSPETAARTVEEMKARHPGHLLTHLGEFLVFAWRGESTAAAAAVSEDLETAARFDDIYPLLLAAGHSALGDLDRAFRWLDEAMLHGITNVDYLGRLDPLLAGMRGDPRFPVLLEKARELSVRAEAAVRRSTVEAASGRAP